MGKKLFIFVFFLFSVGTSFSQLKIHSDGTGSIGTTSSYAGYTLRVHGNAGIMVTEGSSYLRLSSATGNATIGSSSDIVCIWTNSTMTYNDLHIEDLHTHSDSNFKANIEPLESGLETVMQLKPKSYNRVNGAAEVENKESYGFLAQEIQVLNPDLVAYGIDSTLSVLSIDLLPYLVSAIQEQQTQIDSLLLRVTELEKSLFEGGMENKSASIITNENGEILELGQNNPNPFKETTTISYIIPSGSTSAQIIVYDMRGIELRSYNLENFGEGQLIIEGSTFKAGMYMYALIVDGNYIDSKRMILSK